MRAIKPARFSVETIADTLRRFGDDLGSARSALSFAVGSALVVSGKVQKVVKCDGQCKLVIEPGDVPGFVVFADCLSDAAAVNEQKIRKGSAVKICGCLRSFGWSAVCLSDCGLILSK